MHKYCINVLVVSLASLWLRLAKQETLIVLQLSFDFHYPHHIQIRIKSLWQDPIINNVFNVWITSAMFAIKHTVTIFLGYSMIWVSVKVQQCLYIL